MSPELGSGAGSSLPLVVLVLSGVSTLVAVLVSAMSIYLQLKNYRKPVLQRFASERTFDARFYAYICAEWSYESWSWSLFTGSHL